MPSTILLIDGNSLVHRAYHALSPLSTTGGQPTHAAYGFLQMLLTLLAEQRPDVVVLALDARGPTFRHEISPEYKAHRPPMEEDLASQFPIVRDLADALNIPIVEEQGYEADDLIGALATRAEKAGRQVLIVTGDRDLCQLVTPAIEVIAPVKGMSQIKHYDAAAVRAEFGVDPARIVDLKGLAGDSSDNIPGVPGVGPKTAVKLLEQFGSLEAVFDRLDDVSTAKLRENLRAHEDDARLSKRLATIDHNAPVDLELIERVWAGPDTEKLRRLLGSLEFTSLLDRIPISDAPPTEAETGDASSDALQVCSQAAQAGEVGVAVALSGEVPLGIALSVQGEQTVFVEIPSPEAQGSLFGDGTPQFPGCVRDLLADASVRKVGHDLKATSRALDSAGIDLDGFEFDTAVAAYLVAPHRGAPDLDALAAQHLGQGLPRVDAAGKESISAHAARAVAAAGMVLRLRSPLEADLDRTEARSLFDEIEMPLVTVLRDMERAGIGVDPVRLDEIGDMLSGMMTELAHRIYGVAGEEFNLGSPKQIGEVLFGKMGLPHGRKTKTGWATGAEVLETLAEEYEIAALILQHREYSKLKSTYVDGIIPLISADGRLHTTLEQTVVATGRLSSRNPNLQNIPVRTEWGREIRSCFVAQGEGNVLLAADYSQIELRILAHMSGDQSLVAAFQAGEDIHSRTAAAIFDVPIERVTSDMRRVAKTVNYAVIYGMGATALARQLGIGRKEASQFIENYFARLPGVKAYMEGVVERARKDGYVKTLFGRRRPMPDLVSRDPRAKAYAERAAANAPLQGTAADIIKIAMVRLARRLPDVSPECRMLLQVHDDLIFELPESDVDRVAPVVREVMEGAAQLDVPLRVEPKVGANWRDMVFI
ncbi:MAG: DNA polymerase I [Armatimonadetes bacterium]|nr:DNA polymerase I [Armatimonadota bacterium]